MLGDLQAFAHEFADGIERRLAIDLIAQLRLEDVNSGHKRHQTDGEGANGNAFRDFTCITCALQTLFDLVRNHRTHGATTDANSSRIALRRQREFDIECAHRVVGWLVDRASSDFDERRHG